MTFPNHLCAAKSLCMNARFNLNSSVLTGGPEGNGGSQHDKKCGGGGGGGGPLNFRPACKEHSKRRLISQFIHERRKKD